MTGEGDAKPDRRKMASPNSALIGLAGSRGRLTTPALVLDLDRLDRNIAAMAACCRQTGLALRPHAKTHKSVAIARLQIEAGAIGVSCATLGEAEVMVGGGISGVLVTSPVIGEARVRRLIDLNKRATGLMAVVDHPQNLAELAAAAHAAVRSGAPPLSLLVDFDIGLHRTGAASIEDALFLARGIAAEPERELRFAGVQAYAGQLQHVADYAEREKLARLQHARLGELVAALRAAGLAPAAITGAGTGTHDIDSRDAPFTELQAGSYVFMDVDYDRVQLRPGANRPPFENALFVQTSVVSANASGLPPTGRSR